MSEWVKPIFPTLFYLIMKKPKNATENPEIKTEQPVVASATEKKTKKVRSTQKTPKKSPAVIQKPVSKAKTEQPVSSVVTKEVPKKPSPAPKSSKKSQVVTTIKITSSELVGLTAGSIWHYLEKNGATSVAKLVRELPEEEKTINRSIGWLAREDKISLNTIKRVETIVLKE